jgi:hypothetical protein
MFNLAAALAGRHGQYDFDTLQEILRQIRREHLGEISPEVGINELFQLAIQRNWIHEDEAGNFHITIEQAA